MALTEKGLIAQVRRLKSIPLAIGQDWDFLKLELLRVLWVVAESDEHAAEIVSRAIDNKPEGAKHTCPTGADLRAIADGILRERQKEFNPGPTQCGLCGDSGWKQEVRFKGVHRYEFAVPCQCGANARRTASAPAGAG